MEKHRVLVIDDEPDFLELYEFHLSEAGYQVIKKKNAAEAITFLEGNTAKIAAIISDLKMPGINGINFFRVIDEKKLLIHPFIVVSGFCEDRDSNLRYLGVDKVFQKPVEFKKLLAYLKEFIASGYAI